MDINMLNTTLPRTFTTFTIRIESCRITNFNHIGLIGNVLIDTPIRWYDKIKENTRLADWYF